MVFREVEVNGDVVRTLISLSEKWESENSCRGYRTNSAEDIAGRRVFFAEDSGKTVGYLFGVEQRAKEASSVMPEGAPCFEVEELYVIPEKRSRGIGGKLFRFAEETLKDRVEYLTLSTATKNWSAIMHFYIDELGMEFWSARLFKKTPRV